VAYELRESSYTATNTSMLATAYGRTKEFKDRCAYIAVSEVRNFQLQCHPVSPLFNRIQQGTCATVCCTVLCCAGVLCAVLRQSRQ
jgi:hypothetical protein